MAKPLVVLSILGTTLDAGWGPNRWNRWRPNVDLCRHPDLAVHRLELLYTGQADRLRKVIARDVETMAPETSVGFHLLDTENPWDFEEVFERLLHFAQGYGFQPRRYDYLVHITTGTHVAQICLFLLTESRFFPGKLLQTSPPPRGEKGAPGQYTIIDLDLSKYDLLGQRFAEEQARGQEMLKAGIATQNASFNRMIERIEQVAIGSSEPILLEGPTGAGKSHLAGRIYALKQARMELEGKFASVNCATLRGDGAASTLFGHIKGAFTGAVAQRDGLLKTADGGLLFLDEIGELGLDEQAMLLKAIEEKVYYPVGSDKQVRSDFQLVAGTNRDLRQAVKAGRFRDDLLARINLWTFPLPGLAERREDIEPNLDYELESACQRLGKRIRMNQDARRHFLRFAGSNEALWTGNFRDLNAAVTRMATLAVGGRIQRATVVEEIERLRYAWGTEEGGGGESPGATIWQRHREQAGLDALDRFEKVQLMDVISACLEAKSLSEAGRVLFAESRAKRASTNDADRLRKYLARYQLSFAKIRALGSGAG